MKEALVTISKKDSYEIDKMDTNVFMAKNKAISFAAKTINKLHIKKNMHLIYKQDLYKDKKRKYMNFSLNTLFSSWTILIILR